MYLFCISCKLIVATIKVPTLVCKPEGGFRTLLKEVFHTATFEVVIGQPLKIHVFGMLCRFD